MHSYLLVDRPFVEEGSIDEKVEEAAPEAPEKKAEVEKAKLNLPEKKEYGASVDSSQIKAHVGIVRTSLRYLSDHESISALAALFDPYVNNPSGYIAFTGISEGELRGISGRAKDTVRRMGSGPVRRSILKLTSVIDKAIESAKSSQQ